MLVMRRRAGESFQIGADIYIEILDIGQNRVKIGIAAPSALPIVRTEIVLTRDANLAAARTAPEEAIARVVRVLGPAAREDPVNKLTAIPGNFAINARKS